MDNRRIMENLYRSFAEGDMPAVLGGFADDIEWIEAEGFPYGGVYRGGQAVLENVFMRIAADWEGFTAAPDEYLDAGDTIVALGHYSGKYIRTGKSMRVPFAHVWTLRDGRVDKFVQYTDTLKVSEVLN